MTGRWRHTLLALVLACLCWPLALAAQEDSDRGFLTGLLEDSLGGDGREVVVTGFTGAFSSTARIEAITFADDAGIWLRLEGLELQWTRSALLAGQIKVDRLAAQSIRLDRLPNPVPGTPPSPEAGGFSLPQLPVAVNIADLVAEELALGAPILGEAVTLRLAGDLALEGGAGALDLSARRIDGRSDRFELALQSLDESTTAARIRVALREASGGLVSSLLRIPGAPDLSLDIDGQGSASDFTADLGLATDGEDRLSGAFRLLGQENGARGFEARLSGDIRPLLAAPYHPFFSDGVSLRAEGDSAANGETTLRDFLLNTGALQIAGQATLDAGGAPLSAQVDGRIVPPAGGAVVLPVPGAAADLGGARFTLALDRALGPDWSADLDLTDLRLPGLRLPSAALDVRGRLPDRPEDGFGAVDLSFAAPGLEFDAPELEQAAGSDLRGSVAIRPQGESGGFALRDLTIEGADYGLAGQMSVAGSAEAFRTEADLTLLAQDLRRFAGLAGLAGLSGGGDLRLLAQADAGGAFDLDLQGVVQGLALGIEQADALLRGETRLDIRALRDETGTRVPSLRLRNPQLDLTGDAVLTAQTGRAGFDLTLADSTPLHPALTGATRARGRASGAGGVWTIAANIAAPRGISVELDGAATGPAPDLSFAAAVPEIAPFVPAYRGPFGLSGRLSAPGGGPAWSMQADLSGPYQLAGTLGGTVLGALRALRFDLAMPDMAPLGAGISGPLALRGTATETADGRWRLGSDVEGPAGTTARLDGALSPDGSAAIDATGRVPLGLAGPFIAPRSVTGFAEFDLSVNGQPGPETLSGRVTANGVRLSLPGEGIALRDVTVAADIAAGRAGLDVAGRFEEGGQLTVRGPVSFADGSAADLAIALRAARLRDPQLYDTTVSADLALRGPVPSGATLSGRIDIGETRLTVPSAAPATLSAVPEIRHVGARPAVTRTRGRAGLIVEPESGAGGPPILLDLNISAPDRVFLRGRGLDVELGGVLELDGPADAPRAAGGFELIRGRLDLLGKRFVLDDGLVSLQGSLTPWLELLAETDTEAGTARIIIEGPADAPDVRFEADPDAPQDQILAQIFFGRDISQLSPLQALQLANGLAVLAGGGGVQVIGSLRDRFGLDDLDLATDADGTTGLRLGKYLSDNVYSDVTIGNDGSSSVSINIDLTPNITARGSVDRDGDTPVGIFFERDY